MLEVLSARLKEAQTEMLNAKNVVDTLAEQLEKQKIHYHVMTGHVNELNYQVNEAQKLAAQKAELPPCAPVPEPIQEQDNGQANEQAEEQAA